MRAKVQMEVSMIQENVPPSFLVLLAICLSAIQGCQKPAASPSGEASSAIGLTAGKAAHGDNPTPEEARSALIQLVETFDFQKNLHLSKEIADELKSKKTLDQLKNAKIRYHETRQGEFTMIGSWRCTLSEKRFHKPLVTTPSSSMALEGRFEAGPDGRWKAVPGTSIADFPEKDTTPRERIPGIPPGR